jgi:hypothetical protein
MNLEISKTSVMRIGNAQDLNKDIYLQLINKTLTCDDEMKYLGY